MKIYNQTIKFPEPTPVKLVGGHPAGGILLTQGVVIDTIDDSREPYYECYITADGNPAAVYPYTSSRYRIFSQSELAAVNPDRWLPIIDDDRCPPTPEVKPAKAKDVRWIRKLFSRVIS